MLEEGGGGGGGGQGHPIIAHCLHDVCSSYMCVNIRACPRKQSWVIQRDAQKNKNKKGFVRWNGRQW